MKIGIDLYLVGSKDSASSQFEIYQNPNNLFADYNIQVIQNEKIIGEIHSAEMRITSTEAVQFQVKDLVMRTTLTREPNQILFSPEGQARIKTLNICYSSN